MPVPVYRAPFDRVPPKEPSPIELRTPQARILAVLVPEYPEDPVSEWPVISRPQLGLRAGFTVLSGSTTRALNGIREGSSSGTAHPGLLAMGLVEEIVLDVEGVKEVSYRITHQGLRAYAVYVAVHGPLPPPKDAAVATNDRYRKNK